LEKLEIYANIREEKLIEFSQSKLSFLDELPHIEGYHSYLENPGTEYYLCINWMKRMNLDAFLESDIFHFFHGAIITLGKLREINIKSEK
jgi:hypothetical protein